VVRGDLWRTLSDQNANDDRFSLDEREPGSAKDPAKVIIAHPFRQLGAELGQLFREFLCAWATKPELLLNLRSSFDPYLSRIVLPGLSRLRSLPIGMFTEDVVIFFIFRRLGQLV
jgi:hypothetical protein